MSAWRKIAIEKLPRLREIIEQAESIGMLWEDLDWEFRQAHTEPVDAPTIKGTYEFAWWAISASENDEIRNSTIHGFYEDLPLSRQVREYLPGYMTVEQFLGLTNIFKYHLSPEEQEVFVKDFLARRRRLETVKQGEAKQ